MEESGSAKIDCGVTSKKGELILERLRGKVWLIREGSLIEVKSNASAEAETKTRRSRRRWKGILWKMELG